jgi:peptidoglycan/LPS O-acetylase OafA/YrhL
MNEDTAPHEIARLEAQIEALTAAIERCRKIEYAAKIAIAAGALWFVLALTWIVTFDPTFFVGALAACLGGVVLLGSNKTTWEETQAALERSEAARSALIGHMNLRLVGDIPVTPTLH